MDTQSGKNRMSLWLAIRPVRLAFRFDGHSTRTEVMAFYLLSMVMNVFSLHWGRDGSVGNLTVRLLSGGWAITWCWPWLPLLARRLHDQSRSGWWSLLSVPSYPIAAILALTPAMAGTSWMGVTLPFIGTRHLVSTPLTISLFLVGAGFALATIAFYLWRPTRGENRYGPDPRTRPARTA